MAMLLIFDDWLQKLQSDFFDRELQCTEFLHWSNVVATAITEENVFFLLFQNIREQFPNLFERINDIVASFLEQKLKETKDMVEHCVKMQLDYVNVKHPDFLTAQQHAAKRFGEIAALLDSPNKDATDGSTNINGSLRVAPVGNTRASPAPAARGPSRFKADLSDSEEENKKKDEKSNNPIKVRRSTAMIPFSKINFVF
jgi:hypothetical protein